MIQICSVLAHYRFQFMLYRFERVLYFKRFEVKYCYVSTPRTNVAAIRFCSSEKDGGFEDQT